MLLTHEALEKKLRIFCKLTGMTLKQFDELIKKVVPRCKKAFGYMGNPSKLPTLSILNIDSKTLVKTLLVHTLFSQKV